MVDPARWSLLNPADSNRLITMSIETCILRTRFRCSSRDNMASNRQSLLWVLLSLSFSVYSYQLTPETGQTPYWTHDGIDPHDEFSLLPYKGLNTFAAIDYASCFDANGAEESRYDIAILGAPHDTVRPPIAFRSCLIPPKPADAITPDRHQPPRSALRPVRHPNRNPEQGIRLRHIHRARSAARLGQGGGLWRCADDLAGQPRGAADAGSSTSLGVESRSGGFEPVCYAEDSHAGRRSYDDAVCAEVDTEALGAGFCDSL